MPKPYHNLSLAKSAQQWTELDEAVRRHVAKVCGAYDDPAQVSSFMVLLDLATNPHYSQSDREMVIFEVKRQAFQYAPEFQKAQDAYLQNLIPYQEKAAKTA